MSRTFIFAIGGTGARVLRSFSMLLAAGVKTDETNPEKTYVIKGLDKTSTIVPVIIDYDTGNGDTNRTQDILDHYENIHKEVYNNKLGTNVSCDGWMFAANVQKLKEAKNTDNSLDDDVLPTSEISSKTRFEIEIPASEDRTRTFAQEIGYRRLGPAGPGYDTTPTKHLLECLYDTSDTDTSTAELHLNLEVGFKGCPNIGCVVVEKLRHTPEMERLLSMANQNDRFVIIGSVFGGTGASGIPVILNMIRSANDRLKNISTTKIAIIAVEPYFKVVEKSDSAIDSNTFEAKTKAALDAYDLGENGVYNQASAVYYVGDDNVKEPFENFEGGANQKNEAHIVELAGAMCVADFIGRTDFSQKFLLFSFHKGAGMDSDNNIVPFKYDDFHESVQQMFINPLARFALFSHFCRTFVFDPSKYKANDTWVKDSAINTCTDFIANLKATVAEFEKWIKELEGKKRPLKLFNMEGNFDTIFYDIRTRIRRPIKDDKLITTDKINSMLNKKYEERKKNSNSGGEVFVEYVFIKIINEVLDELLNNVLNKHKEQNNQLNNGKK